MAKRGLNQQGQGPSEGKGKFWMDLVNGLVQYKAPLNTNPRVHEHVRMRKEAVESFLQFYMDIKTSISVHDPLQMELLDLAQSINYGEKRTQTIQAFVPYARKFLEICEKFDDFYGKYTKLSDGPQKVQYSQQFTNWINHMKALCVVPPIVQPRQEPQKPKDDPKVTRNIQNIQQEVSGKSIPLDPNASMEKKRRFRASQIILPKKSKLDEPAPLNLNTMNIAGGLSQVATPQPVSDDDNEATNTQIRAPKEATSSGIMGEFEFDNGLAEMAKKVNRVVCEPSSKKAFEIGDVIDDRYVLSKKIGEGGMGTVFVAHDKRLNKKVAVKFLKSELLGNEEFRERLKTEAQATASLQHSNIVTVYDLLADQGIYVMEYIDGVTDLSSQIDAAANKGEMMDFASVLNIMKASLDGLDYAHEKGVLHRDLKPDNIMLDIRKGKGGKGTKVVPKIADFGLAKQSKGSPNLTKEGSVIGTPSYMPPEQAMGDLEAIGPWSDVYSMGATLYEMLTGKVPFGGNEIYAVFNKVINEEAPLPFPECEKRLSVQQRGKMDPERVIDYEVRYKFNKVVSKCLMKKPRARYRSAHEMIEALEKISKLIEGQASMIQPTQQNFNMIQFLLKNPATAAIGTVLFIALLSTIIYLAKSGNNKTPTPSKKTPALKTPEKKEVKKDKFEFKLSGKNMHGTLAVTNNGEDYSSVMKEHLSKINEEGELASVLYFSVMPTVDGSKMFAVQLMRIPFGKDKYIYKIISTSISKKHGQKEGAKSEEETMSDIFSESDENAAKRALVKAIARALEKAAEDAKRDPGVKKFDLEPSTKKVTKDYWKKLTSDDKKLDTGKAMERRLNPSINVAQGGRFVLYDKEGKEIAFDRSEVFTKGDEIKMQGVKVKGSDKGVVHISMEPLPKKEKGAIIQVYQIIGKDRRYDITNNAFRDVWMLMVRTMQVKENADGTFTFERMETGDTGAVYSFAKKSQIKSEIQRLAGKHDLSAKADSKNYVSQTVDDMPQALENFHNGRGMTLLYENNGKDLRIMFNGKNIRSQIDAKYLQYVDYSCTEKTKDGYKLFLYGNRGVLDRSKNTMKFTIECTTFNITKDGKVHFVGKKNKFESKGFNATKKNFGRVRANGIALVAGKLAKYYVQHNKKFGPEDTDALHSSFLTHADFIKVVKEYNESMSGETGRKIPGPNQKWK